MKSLILFCFLALTFTGPATADDIPCPEFTEHFKTSARRYLSAVPVIGWKYLAAQAQAESSCRPNAKSHVGARGLAQFMQATWEEQQRKVPALLHASPLNPKYAVIAQANYMRELYQFCGKRIAEANPVELRKHTAASYNAGLGNICVKAYKLSMSPYWQDTASELPRVTGRHSKETTGYVDRIEQTHSRSLSRRQQVSESLFSLVSSAEASEAPESHSEKTSAEQEAEAKKIVTEGVAQIAPGGSYFWQSIFLNYKFAFLPAILGFFFMWGTYKIVDKLTPNTETEKELHDNNTAYAMWLCSWMWIIGIILSVSIYAGFTG